MSAPSSSWALPCQGLVCGLAAYVVQEVLPSHGSWPYATADERWRMTGALLQVSCWGDLYHS